MIQFTYMVADVQGKNVSYEVMGKGKPILLIHGWGGSSASLKSLAQILSQSHQVILVDLPGFGHSDSPEPRWGVEEYANNLIGLLDALKVKKVDYFGHSFGGSLGIYLAANYLDRIERLILCAPSYSRVAKKVHGIELLKKIVPPRLKLLLYRVFFPRSDISRFPQLEQNFRKIVTQDLTSLLPKIHARTLILWGDKDTYVPVQQAKILHDRIKNSLLKIYPDVSHSLPLKQPELVSKEIVKFLND